MYWKTSRVIPLLPLFLKWSPSDGPWAALWAPGPWLRTQDQSGPSNHRWLREALPNFETLLLSVRPHASPRKHLRDFPLEEEGVWGFVMLLSKNLLLQPLLCWGWGAVRGVEWRCWFIQLYSALPGTKVNFPLSKWDNTGVSLTFAASRM